jgi:5-formyltetrahydrofolate cyclo-ligase
MRARRREVTKAERRSVASALARVANRARLLRPAAKIAVYQAYGHEADLSALIYLARRRGCQLYLPRIVDHRRHRMEFFRFDADAPLRRNAFGILEPIAAMSPAIPTRELDLVLMPLVAFDASGWRLGSGAGFYDRRLHHLHIARRWRRPKLIGVAYHFQRVDRLQPHRWDIPMDAVITERGLQLITTIRG